MSVTSPPSSIHLCTRSSTPEKSCLAARVTLTLGWYHGVAIDGYNRSMASYECKHHSGRWCGLEGTIVDMLTHGATPQQVTVTAGSSGSSAARFALRALYLRTVLDRRPRHDTHTGCAGGVDGALLPEWHDDSHWLDARQAQRVLGLRDRQGSHAARNLDGRGDVAATSWSCAPAHAHNSVRVALPSQARVCDTVCVAGGGNPELTTCLWFVPELLRWVAAVRE